MEEQKKNWINENGNLCFLWEGDDSKSIMTCAFVILALLIASFTTRIQQASAKLRNVFIKALLWC